MKGKILKCERFEMFHGTCEIIRTKEEMTGVWLYRPDYDTWYCKPDDGRVTRSFGGRGVTIKEVDVYAEEGNDASGTGAC